MRRSIFPRHVIAAGALIPALLLSVTAVCARTNPDMSLVTSSRNVAPEARLSVTGAADCLPAAGNLTVSVSVLEVGVTASARGISPAVPGADGKDHFKAELSVGAGMPAFTAGAAEASAFAATQGNAGLTGADQWCAFVNLVVDPSM
jgi:hypothetical protein